MGEIPHVDFISIRPVGSAVLHSIHLMLPFPFEITARWFVILEYLLYSFLWLGLFLASDSFGRKPKVMTIIVLAVSVFLLNQNHYNLFPWTTIDALFFTVISLFLYFRQNPKVKSQLKVWLRTALIVFFFSCAALCRQTFALPALVLVIIMGLEAISSKKFVLFITAAVVGGLPVWAYAFMLILNLGGPDFIIQMTGRTEFWQTGISRYFQEFWETPFLLVYLGSIVLLLLHRLGARIAQLSRIFAFSYIFFFVLLVLLVFLDPGRLFKYSFNMFWISALIWLTSSVLKPQERKLNKLLFWTLLISWTSSISLGDNAPVFAIGLLFIAGMAVTMSLIKNLEVTLKANKMLQVVAGVASAIILVLSVNAQRENNYRDLSARELDSNIQADFPGMGKIKVNERVACYMEEIKRIYETLNRPKGRFVVLPNAALIYPLLDSPNPFPLDWMQGAEFVGSEEEVNDRITSLLANREVYMLIDRYDSKRLAEGWIAWVPDQANYPYIDIIEAESELIDLPSAYFEIRKSR